MKKTSPILVLIAFTLVAFGFTSFANAATITFSNPEGTFLTRVVTGNSLAKSLGTLSIEALEKARLANRLTYSGDAVSIDKIGKYGTSSVQVSARTLRVFGWCYTVNGAMPNHSASETFLTSEDDQVSWFFGYVTQTNNVWSKYCKAVK